MLGGGITAGITRPQSGRDHSELCVMVRVCSSVTCWGRLCQLSSTQQELQRKGTPRTGAPFPLREPLNAENIEGSIAGITGILELFKELQLERTGVGPTSLCSDPTACSLPLPCLEPPALVLLPVGSPVQGEAGVHRDEWCDSSKQQQEAQSLFRQLTLRLDMQRTGMGERCSEGGIAGGCWSSHVLLTSAKSCPKLQLRKFPVQLSANHSPAQADP